MKTLLLTGASGRIGRTFFEASRDHYAFVLTDMRPPEYDVGDPHRFVMADLSDQRVAASLTDGVDAVVHLAAVPDPNATFEALLPANILATTYLLEAAATSKVRRFVFASSAQTIEGYAVDRQVVDGMPTRPANLYAVTKCYGEALCSYYAFRRDLSAVAIRIGAFVPVEGHRLRSARDLSAWLSPRDAAHLIQRAVETTGIDFFVAHGISDNRFKRMDLAETRRVLGYDPQDDAFATFDLPVR